MTIGEHHPHKLIRGRVHRQLYRNMWLQCEPVPMDWRYYEGEEKDHPRATILVSRHYPIVEQGKR